MGDISSKPKAPSPQVVYVPQPVYNAPATPEAGSPANGSGGTGTGESMPTPAQQREKNLLSRQRSRLGTILTGFRGLLAQNDAGGQRKTLLGE